MDSTPGLFRRIADIYTYSMHERADPRTNHWFLITTPVIFPVIFIYTYLVLKWGPNYMKNREPFSFKYTLIIYNFVQVLISIYLFREGFYYGWFNGYSFMCQPVDYSQNPKALRAAHACYWYFMAKIFELMDTVFFVLRKKNNQVSLLHIYHHATMPLAAWATVKYFPGGHVTFMGFINTFVHIVMYFYYMLTVMGPGFKKNIWWKKYITALQLVQFVLAFLHAGLLVVVDCDFPTWMSYVVMPSLIFLCYLFGAFYVRTYILKSKPSEGEEERKELNNNDNSIDETASDDTASILLKKGQ